MKKPPGGIRLNRKGRNTYSVIALPLNYYNGSLKVTKRSQMLIRGGGMVEFFVPIRASGNNGDPQGSFRSGSLF